MRGLAALRWLLARRRFDVVNTHSSTDTWSAASPAPRCAGRRPWCARATSRRSAPRNAATRWLYTRAAARIVTTGEKLRHQVIEETGVAPRRTSCRSRPASTSSASVPRDRAAARAGLGLAQDGPLIGIVATLRSWKGHRHLLAAFAALERPDARLVVVGDGPQRSALEALAGELALGERVRFAGNQANVAPWMQALDVFCLPSYANEGVPQALMQAMACGLPVVTTPVGSIEEIVANGRTGVLVPPEDPARLRAGLAALLADPAYRAALGQAARAVALERFGEDRMVDRMLEVFRAVAGHG